MTICHHRQFFCFLTKRCLLNYLWKHSRCLLDSFCKKSFLSFASFSKNETTNENYEKKCPDYVFEEEFDVLYKFISDFLSKHLQTSRNLKNFDLICKNSSYGCTANLEWRSINFVHLKTLFWGKNLHFINDLSFFAMDDFVLPKNVWANKWPQNPQGSGSCHTSYTTFHYSGSNSWSCYVRSPIRFFLNDPTIMVRKGRKLVSGFCSASWWFLNFSYLLHGICWNTRSFCWNFHRWYLRCS